MRILSKSTVRATALALAFFASACSVRAPWADEKIGDEVNVIFSIDGNILRLPSITVDGRKGRYILGSAIPRTVFDTEFARAGRTLLPARHVVQLGERQSLRINPISMQASGVADAIIGADAWGNSAISIDYRTGVLTYQKSGITTGYMTLFHYQAEPAVTLQVNGRDVVAIVDTASPDTLVLPGASESRGNANVRVAGTDFGSIDVQYSPSSRARIGNRLLSRFLVTIDYGKRIVGLWRDPRIPLAGP